jgi:hypothetical protein
MRGHTFRPFGGDRVAVASGEDLRYDATCFADEVVIDFPSTRPAIDRMRRAFVADDHPATFSAAIEISDRDATLGTTVPLEVPMRCTCAGCGGRGESWTETCLQCSGNGTELMRHVVQITVPAGVRDGARFYFTVTPRHNPSTRIELHVFVDAAQ